MQLKQGVATIAGILRKELERHFNCFLDHSNTNFNPTYIIAATLDLRYKVDDQLKCARAFLKSKCYSQPQVRFSIQSVTFTILNFQSTESSEYTTPDNSTEMSEPMCKQFCLLSQHVIQKQRVEEEDNTADNDSVITAI